MTKERKGPVSIAHALQRFLEGSGLARRVEEASVVPEWSTLVGERIAAVTVPERVANGTLLVRVRSSAWLMELRMMEAEILRRLNAGRRMKIEKIRFLMSGE